MVQKLIYELSNVEKEILEQVVVRVLYNPRKVKP